jgi:hypothetical protein
VFSTFIIKNFIHVADYCLCVRFRIFLDKYKILQMSKNQNVFKNLRCVFQREVYSN